MCKLLWCILGHFIIYTKTFHAENATTSWEPLFTPHEVQLASPTRSSARPVTNMTANTQIRTRAALPATQYDSTLAFRSVTQPHAATSTPESYSHSTTGIAHFTSPHLNITVSTANHTLIANQSSDLTEFWTTFNETFWENFDVRNSSETNQYFQHLDSLLRSGKIVPADLESITNDLALGLSDKDPLIVKMRRFLATYVNRTSVERCNLRVVGYYTSFGTKEATKEMLSSLTHVNYAFPDMGPNGTLWISGNSTVRLRNLMKTRGNSSSPKVLLSVGGYGKAEFFEDIVRLDNPFNNFTLNLKSLIEQFDLDGVDIDWEHPGSKPDDKALFVKFMLRLRKKLDSWRLPANRTRLLLTFAEIDADQALKDEYAPFEEFHANFKRFQDETDQTSVVCRSGSLPKGHPGAAGSEDLRRGYDLKNLMQGDTIDWVNVMAYDYYGAWANVTGPPAPLFFAAPLDYSRKLNVHWTMEFYMCAIKDPKKIVLGVPFYGRFWNNVQDKPTSKVDPMWKTSTAPEGGEVNFSNITKGYLTKGFFPAYNTKAQASYAFNPQTRKYLGYESPNSLERKIEYAVKKRFGGVMIWAIDQDDDELTMLQTVTHGDICAPRVSDPPLVIPNYFCYDQRWWSTETPSKSGMCGPKAPLINGYYPVCDPGDDNYACCGRWGFCGSGPQYCDCPECVNYARFPEKILEKSVKPTTGDVLWYTLDYPQVEFRGRCGYGAPLLNGNVTAICNPDDPLGYCCSSDGICGNEPDSCNCPTCINFKKTPEFRFQERKPLGKLWWTWEDSPDNAGKCGQDAPKINGSQPVCDPYSGNAYCCSLYGYCGAGEGFCGCKGCTDYRKVFA